MAPKAEPKSKRGPLIAIVIVAALLLGYVISSVVSKPPPAQDSTELEKQLTGQPQGGGGDSLESRLGK